MLSNFKIGTRFGLAFFTLILFTFFLGGFNYLGIQRLSELTQKLYQHPFAVSNAVREADRNIIAMHRSMKDVVLSKNELQLLEAIQAVALSEDKVLSSLKLVEQRFLGDKTLINNVQDLLISWKPIRDEVIIQHREGEYYKAAELTRSAGALHVKKIETAMLALSDFANKKADHFMANVIEQQRKLNLNLVSGLLVLILFSTVVALLVTRSITFPVKAISQSLVRLASGHSKERIPFQYRKDEIGLMAVAAEKLRFSAAKSFQIAVSNERIAELSSRMQKTTNPYELSQAVMSYISPLLEMVHAGFYLFDQEKETLLLAGSYVLNNEQKLRMSFELGESLTGQCAVDKKLILMTNIATDYGQIDLALGHAKPMTLIAIPIIHQNELLAVIEMASFHPMTEHQLEFLENIVDAIALNLENLNNTLHTKELLSKTRRQAKELTNLTDNLQQQKKELKERAQEQEQASQYKSEFLANMSHELRTPLNSIMLLSKMLSSEEAKGIEEEPRRQCRIIYTAGSNLLQLINEVLDLAKIEAGKMSINIKPIKINSLLNSLHDIFEEQAKEQSIQLTFKQTANCPDEIITDTDRVEQILRNFLSNALKFTHKGQIKFKIELANASLGKNLYGSDALKLALSQTPEQYIAFSVEDTGIGILQDKFGHIFQSFNQADGSINRKYGGTGLGLSISLEIALLLEGGIELSSIEGEGSIFTLILPLSHTSLTSNMTAVSTTSSTTAPPTSRSTQVTLENKSEDTSQAEKKKFEADSTLIRSDTSLANKTILVVDDDIQNSFTVSSILHNQGIKVINAEDGQDGIDKLLANHEVDLVLMDIMMPVMNGLEAVQTIRSIPQYANLPIVVLTAKTDQESRQDCMEAGVTDYISKPINSDAFLSLLSHLLQQN
ncbi:MAG: response regulator [Gammaproteobacteria bacterium]|nr:response regulator [Gammaproteobacteria bacterium]